VSRPSNAFQRLHPKLQRWMYRLNWTSLRPIQEAAVEPILAAERDVILAAPTAGGKTEAAFFPILTSLAKDPIDNSAGALCLSPLKALINDQFERLEELGAEVEVPVHRWHGDVSAARKRSFRNTPSGLLLITPESLEAFFVRRGPEVPRYFVQLRYVVVDELHSFVGTERGRQLQSLLHRLELSVRRRIPRIALSATLGDLHLASSFLRPTKDSKGEQTVLIEDQEGRQEVKLQVRGYRQRAVLSNSTPETDSRSSRADDQAVGDALEIARDLFERLRGGHHLIFANRRADVERYADLLRKLSEHLRVPNEFHPHHGSLSRELREEAERAINDRSRPTSLVATTTLELGIDVGAIESVAQIGTPPSVAALRQRLGRSGREGGAAVLRMMIQEHEVGPDTPAPSALHPELLQTTAMVELLIQGWVEPPSPTSLHLSTLVQQTLSLLAQHGGARAQELWRALCDSGPFTTVSRGLFGDFLRSLGKGDLITQDHAGDLSLGLQGERLVDHYSFYAAFSTPEEYRLMSGGKTLGQLPISVPLFPGLLLIFGGRRWRILNVDDEQKVVDVEPARGGRTPSFIGAGGPMVHDRVREEMRRLYTSDTVPRYLDRTAKELVVEARAWFKRFDLDRRAFLAQGESIYLFPWAGDRVLGTLALLMSQEGLQISVGGFLLEVERSAPDQVIDCLRTLASRPLPDPRDLARKAGNRKTEKFHAYLDDPLLVEDYASSFLDLPGASIALQRLVRHVTT
jgi:ATP-dependent helicase Lhr and Lhr-like helicase